MGDDLLLFEPLNRAVGQVGIPWYNVLGNHDVNDSAKADVHADETLERVHSPANYACEYASVHFVVLDDVIYGGGLAQGNSAQSGVGRCRRTRSPLGATTRRVFPGITWSSSRCTFHSRRLRRDHHDAPTVASKATRSFPIARERIHWPLRGGRR